MPRGPTAYFLFTAENRSAVQEELKSKATSENEKISVAAISKAIGEKWRSLSDEEKQRYKDLAAEKAAEISKGTNLFFLIVLIIIIERDTSTNKIAMQHVCE